MIFQKNVTKLMQKQCNLSIMYLFLSRSFDVIVRPWTVISMDSKQPWALCVAYRLPLIGCSISSMSCLLLVFACMNRCDMHCAVFPMLDLEDLFSISYNLRIFLIYWIFFTNDTKLESWFLHLHLVCVGLIKLRNNVTKLM